MTLQTVQVQAAQLGLYTSILDLTLLAGQPDDVTLLMVSFHIQGYVYIRHQWLHAEAARMLQRKTPSTYHVYIHARGACINNAPNNGVATGQCADAMPCIKATCWSACMWSSTLEVMLHKIFLRDADSMSSPPFPSASLFLISSFISLIDIRRSLTGA